MKRDPALVPLSHDHHQTLVDARRLRRGEPDAAHRFLEHLPELARHFREEEEYVFPLLARQGDPPPELAEALAQHARIRALAARLETGDDAAGPELGDLLERHVRLEERVLFERVQELAGDALASLPIAPREGVPDGAVVDLAAGTGTGPLWGTASEDLNATLLAWPPGKGTPEHAADRDVLVVVLAGSAEVEIDGEPLALHAPGAVVVPKGASRRITAGAAGVRYLTAHLRRPGLMPTRR
jgi:mannose-6-phosphate isomerase-like protein (cupin superfamily)